MAQTIVINHIDEICNRKNISFKQLSADTHIGDRQLLRIRRGEAVLSHIDANLISDALGEPCSVVFEIVDR